MLSNVTSHCGRRITLVFQAAFAAMALFCASTAIADIGPNAKLRLGCEQTALGSCNRS